MCPLLLSYRVDDKQMPTSNARKLFGALGSKDKMLKIFTAKEGSPQNYQHNNQSLGVTRIADWLMEKFRLRGEKRGGRVCGFGCRDNFRVVVPP